MVLHVLAAVSEAIRFLPRQRFWRRAVVLPRAGTPFAVNSNRLPISAEKVNMALATCPFCSAPVPNWGSACPKCHNHPEHYNRALDDVALVFRLAAGPTSPRQTTGQWWEVLPQWLRGRMPAG